MDQIDDIPISLIKHDTKDILNRLHENYSSASNNVTKSVIYLIASMSVFEMIRAGGLKFINAQGGTIEFKFYVVFFPLLFSLLYYGFSVSYYYLMKLRIGINKVYVDSEPGISKTIRDLLYTPNAFDYESILSSVSEESPNSNLRKSKTKRMWPYLAAIYFGLNCVVIIPSYVSAVYRYSGNWRNIYYEGMLGWPFDYSASWYIHELEPIRKYMLLCFLIISLILMFKSVTIIRKTNNIISRLG